MTFIPVIFTSFRQVFRRIATTPPTFSNEFSPRSTMSINDLILQHIEEVSSGDGQCVYLFKVSHPHLNQMGSLHGGVTASVIDVVTTYALMSAKKPTVGVSVDLCVSYIGAAKEGDELLIEAKTIKSGRTLAFIDAIVRRKSDNAVIATGKHTKFVQIGNL